MLPQKFWLQFYLILIMIYPRNCAICSGVLLSSCSSIQEPELPSMQAVPLDVGLALDARKLCDAERLRLKAF